MTGADVKQQVMETLDAYARSAHVDELASCIVLTAEEAERVRHQLQDAPVDVYALFTPEQENA